MGRKHSKVSLGGPPAELRMLGRPAALVAGEAVRGLPRKAEALLFLLAISGRTWSRPDVSELLWGDRDAPGRQNLRVALTKIPRALADLLVRDADCLALPGISSDLPTWLDRCTTIQRTSGDDLHAEELDRALEELAGWPGDLLEGFEPNAPGFDDWCHAERQRVLRQFQDSVFAATARLAPTGCWRGAERALGRVLELDPANETAHRWLIQCYLATNRPEAARGQYELCKRQLATLLGARPTPATQALLGTRAAEATAARPTIEPMHPGAPPSHNNLPRPLNSFIGRVREMKEIRELLGRHPLVTLFGAGGIGKTRLSVQVGTAVVDQYPDGVWLVDLAPIAEGHLVAQAIAITLGIAEIPGRPVIEAIERHVANRRLLIILDNCEHVVDAVAECARRIMQAGSRVSLLATSREWLHIAGEATYDVPTLGIAPDAGRWPLEKLLTADAVQLFADRATAARADFRLDGDNAGDVADICRRLDGLPLAIELAAARVRTLTVGALASHLKERLHLPGTGDRGHRPRQQTLHALIDWSYRLLDEDEARLFRRLSVFAGGWTIDAAKAVAGGEINDAGRVLDLLGRLVEKSLAALDATGNRYRLLEVVRAFAREQLDAKSEVGDIVRHHVEHYLDLSEAARPHLAGADQAVWLARLDVERENLLAAFRRSARLEDGAEIGVRLIHALRPWLLNRGLITLGLDAARDVLARPGMAEWSKWRYQALFNAGQICNFSGRWQEAMQYLTEGLEISRALEDTLYEAGMLQQLGYACLEQGDQTAARHYYEQGVELAERLGNRREQAAAYNALAQCLRIEGHPGALQLLEKALSIAREIGDFEYVACCLLNLAMVSVGNGATGPARDMLREALDIAVATGSMLAGKSVMEVCAGLAAKSRQWSQAARFFGVAEEQEALTALRRDPVDEDFLAPLIETTRLALGDDAFAAAAAEGRALPYSNGLDEAGTWLAVTR